jgi:hypothetical protein
MFSPHAFASHSASPASSPSKGAAPSRAGHRVEGCLKRRARERLAPEARGRVERAVVLLHRQARAPLMANCGTASGGAGAWSEGRLHYGALWT